MFLTITQAANLMSVSPRSLQRRVAEGEIPVVEVFGMKRIALRSIMEPLVELGIYSPIELRTMEQAHIAVALDKTTLQAMVAGLVRHELKQSEDEVAA